MPLLKTQNIQRMHVDKEDQSYKFELTEGRIKAYLIEGKDGSSLQFRLSTYVDFSNLTKIERRVIYAPKSINESFIRNYSELLNWIYEVDSKDIDEVDFVKKVKDGGNMAAAMVADGIVAEKEAIKQNDKEALKSEIKAKFNDLGLTMIIEMVKKEKDTRIKLQNRRTIAEILKAINAFMTYFVLFEKSDLYEESLIEVAEELLGESVSMF